MLLEIVSAAIGITGALLVALKNKTGFLFWVVGNLLWIVYGLITKQYFFMTQYVVFWAISVFGFINWRKQELKNKNKK